MEAGARGKICEILDAPATCQIYSSKISEPIAWTFVLLQGPQVIFMHTSLTAKKLKLRQKLWK